MKKASIRDVALHAGVSTATVSHVLNHTRFVAEDTREKVLNSIRDLDYSPDVIARSFKTGRRYLIGFIVPDIANEYYSIIIETIESIITKEEYKLVIANTKETKSREIENLRALGNGIVDGIIVASTLQSYAEMERIVPASVPMLFIDRTLPGCPFSTITISNYSAVYSGVERLILDGHRKIGYITGLPYLSTTEERLDAYKDAMEAHGIPIEESFIRFGDSLRSDTANKMDELLDAGCTALVASNNVMADEVLFHMAERGIRVGKDVGLLGYNEGVRSQFNMRYIHHITQPAVDLGRTAGLQILNLLRDPQQPVRNTVLQAGFTPGQPKPNGDAV